MRYMRCKCGKRACWTSMGHPECDGCPDCNTTLAEAPDRHTEPIPHDFREEFTVDPRTGQRSKERVCLRCMKREPVMLTVYIDDHPFEVQAGDANGMQLKIAARVSPIYNLSGVSNGMGFIDDDVLLPLTDGMRFISSPPGHF